MPLCSGECTLRENQNSTAGHLRTKPTLDGAPASDDGAYAASMARRHEAYRAKTGAVTMDDLEISQGTGGLDRRSFIQKSALVGGMVWAAPLVSSFGSPAFAGTLQVINGKTPDPDKGAISNIAIYLANGGAVCKADFDKNLVEDDTSTNPCVANLGDAGYPGLLAEWEATTGTCGNLVTVQYFDDARTALIIPDEDWAVKWAVVKRGGQTDDCLLFLNKTEPLAESKGFALQVSNRDSDADKVFNSA